MQEPSRLRLCERAQECVMGPGVCRPVIVLHALLRSLFSRCSYSDEVPLAHCYSARVREGGRERLTGPCNGGELLVLVALVALGGLGGG